MTDLVPVRFETPDTTLWVRRGETLLDAAVQAGLPLPFPCGGRAECGKCTLRVLAGEAPPPDETERSALRAAGSDVRLACRLRVTSPLTVRPLALLPVPQVEVAVPPQAEETVAAADLGTTVVTGAVVDPVTGREASRGETPNRQSVLGADVTTRVSAALSGRGRRLRELAVFSLSAALGAASSSARIVVVSANGVMAHLATGSSVQGFASHPYRASWSGPFETTAGELGLEGPSEDALVWFVPAMAPFVGGDATSGVVALGLDEEGPVRVLVDLGTNAEVVVSAAGRLTAASAAAGPAFEGGRVSCGSSAFDGAVEGADVEGDEWRLRVIGGREPSSMCGSGLLEALAALRRTGHLDENGRLDARGPLGRHFHERDEVLAVQVHGAPGGPGVYITQLDVRELQLAKAAVATGLEYALERAGVGWASVATVYVAGNLGRALRAGVLRDLGMLPRVFEGAAVFAGNTSLAGAVAMAAAEADRDRARRAASSAVIVEPALEKGFGADFLRNTAFP